MRGIGLVALAGLALAAGPLRADEITDQLDQARAFYDEGDVGGAIGELEFVLQALRGRLSALLKETFPPAPSGWTASDGEAGGDPSGFLGGSVVERSYREDGGGGVMDARLMTGGGFLQGMAAMMMSPQVLAAQPGAKRIRVGRENGVVTYDASGRSGQLVVGLGDSVTLMIEGRDLAGPEPMEALIAAWDVKRVREIVAP